MPSSCVNQNWLQCLTAGLFISLTSICGAQENAAQLEHFEKVIRPLLVKHCYECHSHQAKRLEANLYLDSRDGLLRGGDSGAAIIPGAPEKSPMIEAVRYETFEMPPRGKLPEGEINALIDWVRQGAPWPEEAAPAAAPPDRTFNWKERRAAHWSWQPVTNPAVPKVTQADWPKQTLDYFVLAKLEENQLSPAPPADPRTWLRRVYFDLIGLPPTPEQIQDFLADPSDAGRARVVDDLLSSPRFGEKWARHWMDLVRYAESYGHEFDYSIPHAYQYRDYLIRAFNSDVPYDQLVREHLAGDLLSEPRRHPVEGFNESIIGSGFWYLGEAVHAPTNVKADLSIRVENQIDVMSRAFLGLSVACARCHDHKFDAISKEDYYALYGILNSTHRDEAWLDPQGKIAATVQKLDQSHPEASSAFQSALDSPLQLQLGAEYLSAAFRVLDAIPEAPSPPQNSRQQSEQQAYATAISTRNELKQAAAEEIAAASGLEQQRLLRWVNAWDEIPSNNLSHPLSLAKWLSDSDNAPLVDRRKEGFANLQNHQKEFTQRWNQQIVLETFDGNDWGEWQSTGLAFGEGPTTRHAPIWTGSTVMLSSAGTASSRSRSGKLRGALRSPLFVLQHPALHYRIRGKGVIVRVAIENYFMDHYHSLLFNDVTKKNIDTNGEWTWITQRGDLHNFIGRQAFLEILDTGDGEAEIDMITFSNGPAPIDPPSKLAYEIAQDETISSREELARACTRQWNQILQAGVDHNTHDDELQVINWLLKHQLVELPSNVLTQHEKMRTLAMQIPAPVPVLASVDGPGIDEPVHIRGSDENFGAIVPRRFLQAISGEDQPEIVSGSGRLELATRITNPENPFLSRVMVNRLWHHIFGQGIVPSVDDFGAMGQPPSHPELLDWLATDFQQKNYSIKQMLKMLVLSATYSQSSDHHNAQAEEMDPDNIWLHRASIRRLPAESIRDAILSVSGRLDLTMYGPGVPVHLSDFSTGRGRPQSGPIDGNGRRSVYQQIRRNFLPAMMMTFDMPSPFSCMGRRSVSNVPAQSLILMNNPFVTGQAAIWGKQIAAVDQSHADRLRLLFEQAFGRNPTQTEIEQSLAFLQEQATLHGLPPEHETVWADLCHMLINTKEFIFIQ